MDETFLDSNHAIPEANIRALKRMKELGGFCSSPQAGAGTRP